LVSSPDPKVSGIGFMAGMGIAYLAGDALGNAVADAVNDICHNNRNDCEKLYYEIDRYVNQLQRRFRQYRTNLGNLGESGTNSRQGHRDKIKNIEQYLRKKLAEANTKGCILYRKDAWHWATRPIAY